MAAPEESLSLDDLDSLVAEDLPGCPAEQGGEEAAADEEKKSTATINQKKAAIYDAKIAQFKAGSIGAKKKGWKGAGAATKVGVALAAPAAATPKLHNAYSGHFGKYDNKGAEGGGGGGGGGGGLLRGIRAKVTVPLLLGGTKKQPERPDPWAGFVMPETLSSDEEDDGGEKPPRTGEELWRILRGKWKVFRASKGWLVTMRTVHGDELAATGATGDMQFTGNSMEDMAVAKQMAAQRVFFFIPDSPFRQK
jgi:hypothetical protein